LPERRPANGALKYRCRNSLDVGMVVTKYQSTMDSDCPKVASCSSQRTSQPDAQFNIGTAADFAPMRASDRTTPPRRTDKGSGRVSSFLSLEKAPAHTGAGQARRAIGAGSVTCPLDAFLLAAACSWSLAYLVDQIGLLHGGRRQAEPDFSAASG
jgi:hypothetical protein